MVPLKYQPDETRLQKALGESPSRQFSLYLLDCKN
jgi:hypothetical protein